MARVRQKRPRPEGLTLAPSYRPGWGCPAMPGKRVVFPVVNIQYTGPYPVTPSHHTPTVTGTLVGGLLAPTRTESLVFRLYHPAQAPVIL